MYSLYLLVFVDIVLYLWGKQARSASNASTRLLQPVIILRSYDSMPDEMCQVDQSGNVELGQQTDMRIRVSRVSLQTICREYMSISAGR
jgi:hypothetical protein